jgi:hypothetical protein
MIKGLILCELTQKAAVVSPQNSDDIQTKGRSVTSDKTGSFGLQLSFHLGQLFEDLHIYRRTYIPSQSTI